MNRNHAEYTISGGKKLSVDMICQKNSWCIVDQYAVCLNGFVEECTDRISSFCSWCTRYSSTRYSNNKINWQSLQDTQVGYISQNYTLDNYTLEKYTLAQKSLVMVAISLVMVATSLAMVANSLVMVATSSVMVATFLVNGRMDQPTSDMGRC